MPIRSTDREPAQPGEPTRKECALGDTADAAPSNESTVPELGGLWSLTWPLLWSLALSLSLTFVDSFFLSRVSDVAAAAVGALLPVLGVTLMVFSPMAQAGASVAGQLMGAGRRDAVGPTYFALLLFNGAFGLVASALFALLSDRIVLALGLSSEMAEHASTYLALVGGCQFLKALQLAFVNVLNSRGETRWVMAEAALTNATNIVLNLAFVRAGMGVAGVALATAISLGVGLLWTAGIVRYRLRVRIPLVSSPRAIWSHLRPIAGIGLPGAMEPMSFQCMHIVLNATIVTLGAQVMAARVYVLNFFLVSTILWGVAFGVGTQISVARRVGEGDFEAANQVLHRALAFSVGGNLVLCTLLLLARRPLLGLLTQDPTVVSVALPLFLVAPFVEVGRAFNIVAGGALRSSGDARFTAGVGSLMMWCLGLPLSYALCKPLGFGLTGVWIGMAVDEMSRGALNYFRWRHGGWRSMGIARAPVRTPAE